MITGNKGEWSEIYTFLKLVSERKLFPGNAYLNRIEDFYYPLISVLRKEISGDFHYRIQEEYVLITNPASETLVPIESFKHKAAELFEIIKSSNGVFGIPHIEKFMESIYCFSLKAKSSDKTDITVVLHDLRTGLQSERGFSIKSKLGSPSTLFNANGDNTSFVYEVVGIDNSHLKIVNSLKFFKAKFAYLKSLGASVYFKSLANKIIQNNLIYVDYCLPQILADVVLLYYSSELSKISAIASLICEANPLNFDVTFKQNFYEHKIKRFLTDVALGLKPGKPWQGIYEASGGYIIVKEDGELICYHIYDKNQFEDYLFNNTTLDTPSTTRHHFGDVFELEGKFYIKLNLQIRFL